MASRKRPTANRTARIAARAAQIRKVRRRTSAQGAVASVVREAQAALDARSHTPAANGAAAQRSPAPCSDGNLAPDLFGCDPEYAARLRPLLEFLYRRYFRVELQGVSHIPHQGPALLVANHAGALPYDSLMMTTGVQLEHAAQRGVRPLIEDELWHLPFLGVTLRRLGGVRANPENAERLIAGGQLVAVFPEGAPGRTKRFRDRYRLQRFGRGGFVKLALRTRAPIIPTAVVGAEETNPLLARGSWLGRVFGLPPIPITPTFPLLGPLGLLPLPAKWTIAFGPPIDLTGHPASAADDLVLVQQLTEQVRSTIQSTLDGLLAQRKSITFG